MKERTYTLITGGAGFIGSNLADALLSEGQRVVIADNLSREGVQLNAQWLRKKHGELLEVAVVDITDAKQIAPLLSGADCVYHLAAQVAVTTSLEDPAHDLQSNLLGTFHILEAARAMRNPPPLLFTSTNKVYGDLADLAIELRKAAA